MYINFNMYLNDTDQKGFKIEVKFIAISKNKGGSIPGIPGATREFPFRLI